MEVRMNYQFAYTRLLVSNFKACFLFYRDVMGFKATFGSENDVYADFNTGGVTLALFDRSAMSTAIGTSNLPGEVHAQDKMCLVFAVDDVDAKCQHLKQQAITLLTEPTDKPDWGIRVAHFRDPDGNLIEINQPLKQP
jgi:lactoylglutathione lyase